MKLLRLFLFLIISSIFIFSCSNDDTDTIDSHQNKNSVKRSTPDRTFPIEDLRFRPTQEDVDYFNTIIDKVQRENTILNELSTVLYFGYVMWDAPKIIRNLDEGVVYTFVPVFDPTNYEISHFFGIKDYDGILTYQLESDDFIRESIFDNNLNFHVINSANLFVYFDYNFGFTEVPLLHEQIYEDGDDGGDISESGFGGCFSTTYLIDVLCTCGASHSLGQIGDCICNDAGQSCGCPDVYSTGFTDCWLQSDGGGPGGGLTVNNGSGGYGGWTSAPVINKLKYYVDYSTWQLILDLVNTSCKSEIEDYYKLIIKPEYSSSFVNCAIQEMSVLPDGSCTQGMPPTLAVFDFDEIDNTLLDWVIYESNSGAVENNVIYQLDNPVCDMIGAGFTESEIQKYLFYLKTSLNNDPDPGYNDGNGPDPYSAYNIENTIANSNKVSQFFIDNPCIKPSDNLGLLLSKPDVVDWAIGFLDGDCGNVSKTNYTNVVFNALKADSEFVPERFSELYSIFTNSNDDILLSDCTYDITPWIDLASFVIPEEVNARLESLGWDNQDIDATGFWAMESKKVNLDYHSVTIDQLPDLNGDGIATPKELFDEIRINFPDYADGELTVVLENWVDFNVATSWSVYGNDFEDYWNTSDALKTILEIDTESNPNGDFPSGLTDDATVICSSYDDECCWVFSTVFTNNYGNSNNGSHPVSGNRQFGLKQLSNGKYQFYIKATDRARISWVANILGYIFGGNNSVDVFYQITDKSWDNLMSNIAAMVNNPPEGATPGIATQNSPITIRPKWSDVRDKLKSAYPLNVIPCDN